MCRRRVDCRGFPPRFIARIYRDAIGAKFARWTCHPDNLEDKFVFARLLSRLRWQDTPLFGKTTACLTVSSFARKTKQ